jgi:CubicO group peptidase (beta-lactamase class C family)
MTRTEFAFSAEMSQLAATAYQKRWSWMTSLLRLILPRWVFGDRADGFVAVNRFCLNGAAVFLRAQLNGGEVEGRRILSARSVALMQTVTAHGPRLDVALGRLRGTGRRHSDSFLERLGGGGSKSGAELG